MTPSPEKETNDPSSPDYSFKKPELKKVLVKQKSDAKERSTSPEPKFLKPKLRKVPSSLRTKDPIPREKLPTVELKKVPAKEEAPRKESQLPKSPSIARSETNKRSEY